MSDGNAPLSILRCDGCHQKIEAGFVAVLDERSDGVKCLDCQIKTRSKMRPPKFPDPCEKYLKKGGDSDMPKPIKGDKKGGKKK